MINLEEPVHVNVRHAKSLWHANNEPDYKYGYFDDLPVLPPFNKTRFSVPLYPLQTKASAISEINIEVMDMDSKEFRDEWEWRAKGRSLKEEEMEPGKYKWEVDFDMQPHGGVALLLKEHGLFVDSSLMFTKDSFYNKNVKGFLVALLNIALFSISLMHCKNVELIDMPISRQQRRLAERKNKPLIQYKTLVIEPFKKQVRNEASEHGQFEIQRALHIARGHFRTYTEEKPLFGRVSGTFWIPMHLRGNKSKGEVHKDYEVRVEE